MCVITYTKQQSTVYIRIEAQAPGCQEWQVPMPVAVFKFDSVVKGHHVYKTVPSMKCCKVVQVDMNDHDEYTAAIVKEDCIVGNVPREIPRICVFLKHGTKNKKF